MRLILLSVTLLMALLQQIALAQNARPDSPATLNDIAQHMQSGIYERIINLGYIPSPYKYRRRFTPQAHNEFTLLFFRIYDFEPTSDRRAYVGKLFMSERYLESHYNKKYKSRRIYEDDKDGFFFTCKLYFDERSQEFRLNVYPEYVLNICRKGMHYNKDRCITTEQHWKSIKYVAQLADRHFDHFSNKDISASTKAFLKLPDPQINIQKICDSDSFKARNLIRTINLEKQIKIFKVGLLGEPNIGNTLTLKLTKYPLSEDLIEGTEYTYNFIARDSLNDNALAKRGQSGYFVSRNPLYRSLILSREPDDQFVPGVNLSKQLQLAYPIGNEYYRRDAKDVKNNGESASASKLTKEDSSAKVIQKRTDSLKTALVIPDLEDRILISSNASRSTFWVYGGPEVAPEKMPKKDSLLQLQEPQYLRDTIPIHDSKNHIWVKGKISFWNVKVPTESKDSTICLIEPDDKKFKWRIESTPKLVPAQPDTLRHVWIQVMAIDDRPIPKRRPSKEAP